MKFKRGIKDFTKKILYFLFFPLRIFFPVNDIILISTANHYDYRDNTRYLFEFVSKYTNLKIYWLTKSEKIIKYLKYKNYKYINLNNKFEVLYFTLSAKVIINSGTSFYNFLGLLSKKCIKICTMHGNGPKAISFTHEDINESLKMIYMLNDFDYVNFPSKYSKKIRKKCLETTKL